MVAKENEVSNATDERLREALRFIEPSTDDQDPKPKGSLLLWQNEVSRMDRDPVRVERNRGSLINKVRRGK